MGPLGKEWEEDVEAIYATNTLSEEEKERKKKARKDGLMSRGKFGRNGRKIKVK